MKTIDERIAETRTKLDKLIQQKHKKCPHKNVELSGGGIWNDWPDWGYNSYYVKCLDCELSGSDDDKDKTNYNKLKSLVTVDKSSHERF
jgi:hypothetical protein